MKADFEPEQFLAEHWQKSACYIPKALAEHPDFLSADELAGLALEEEVESRIIRCDNHQWQIQHGPFEDQDFANLPASHWTLLVQTLDHWLPQANQLLSHFDFIPRWRLDDIMLSFATDGGGVGPHFDNYDVFLIQGSGSRRWRVGNKGDIKQQRQVIDGLLHLDSFEPVIDVVMQPGDLLYVPPETPHWGESIGESMGYSVGYRALQTRDLLALLANHFDNSADNQFFADGYRNQVNPDNRLERQLLNWASKQLQQIAADKTLLGELLSNALSEPKLDTHFEAEHQADQLEELEQSLEWIQLSAGANCNWVEQPDSILLSIEGETFVFEISDREAVIAIAKGERQGLAPLSQCSKKFAFYQSLARLLERGVISSSK